jgi:hypothetical protein
MCGVHKDAGVLGRDNRLDDVGDIVYVRKSFYAKEDIIKGLFGRMGSIFGGSNDSMGLEALVAVECRLERDAVLCNALVSRLPHERDVAGVGRLQPPGKEGRNGVSTH